MGFLHRRPVTLTVSELTSTHRVLYFSICVDMFHLTNCCIFACLFHRTNSVRVSVIKWEPCVYNDAALSGGLEVIATSVPPPAHHHQQRS